MSIPGGIDTSLKLLLLRFQTELTGLDASLLDATHRNILTNLQDRLSETLHFLDTIQVTNLPSPNRPAVHLQIPFLLDGSMRTADLEISGDGQRQGSQVDPENLNLTLSVDLTGLGPVKVHLIVVQGRASCNIHVADQERSDFLQTITVDLERSLERCGYVGANISCRTDEVGSDDTDVQPSVGLDLRV